MSIMLSTDQQSHIDEALNINREAYELRYNNPELGQSEISQAFSLLNDLPLETPLVRKALAECLITAAGLHYSCSEFEAGVTKLHESYKYFESLDDKFGMARVCNVYGVIYQPWGDFAQALDYYLQALTLLEGTPKTDYFHIAVIGNLGLAYLEMGEYKEAETYLQESLKYAQQVNNDQIAGDVYDNLCKLYIYKKEFERALDYGQQSLEMFTSAKHLRGQADAYNSLGHVHMAIDKPEQALDYHQKALDLTQQLSHRYEEVESHRFIALALSSLEKFKKALSSIQSALQLAQELEVPQLTYRCHRDLADIYKKSGDFESALTHYELFYALKEAIFNQNTERRLRTMALMEQLKDAQNQTELLQQKNEDLEIEIKVRKRLQAQLEYIATIDSLTELLNRRAFFQKIDEILHEQTTVSIAAILLDIDNFKDVNDRHGHLAGDLALRTVAIHIQKAVQPHHLPCRFGGDEFAIILPNTSLEQVTEFATQLYTQIVETTIAYKETEFLLETSLGIAISHDMNIEVDHLLDRADQALYQAKNAGKNQINVYENHTS